MDIIFFLILFSVVIGWWANYLGRNIIGWFLCSLLISPLITAIILLIIGKTIEKKAEEMLALTALVNKE
jgi:putative effector of murein hydrolase